MIYGYARVLTRGQEWDGNNLEIQEKELLGKGWEVAYYGRYLMEYIDSMNYRRRF